jgi:hypothetical protein
MLAHTPPLPLIIDYFDGPGLRWDIKADVARYAEGIVLALELRDRIRRVRLRMPISNLKKIISMAFDKEYPVLEYLIMAPPIGDRSAALMPIPETLQTPHLRHLVLRGFALPVGFRLLTTATGVVSLGLLMDHPSSYFRPSTLLQWISCMPQLERLTVTFTFPVPNRDVPRPKHTPIERRITLPNLHYFYFEGVSAYMEAVVPWITAPRLEKLKLTFFKQPRFSVPRLLEFINTTEKLRFDSANFKFSNHKVYVEVYPPEEDEIHALSIQVNCWPLELQVSSVAQIFHSLGQIFSTVKHLTLKHEADSRLYEELNEVDHTEWRKLLMPFSDVKTLFVDDAFVEELSRTLGQHDGEFPLELLPELEELTYSGSDDTGDLFTSFINARQSTGRPVTVVRFNPISVNPFK